MKREHSFFPGLQEGLPEKRETGKLGIRMTRDFGRKSPGDVLFSGNRVREVGSHSKISARREAVDVSEKVETLSVEGERSSIMILPFRKGWLFL